MSDNLPRLVSPGGEVIRAFTAEDLLAAAGITDPTGDVGLALKGAEDSELALFDDGAKHLTSIAREAREMVGAELIRRLDRSGKWTRHVGEFTVSAPSPEAGTLKYDSEKLRAELLLLVAADVIDYAAVDAAVERVEPPKPEPYLKQNAAGIKALLKLGPVVRDAVLSAQVPVEPAPKRAAKVVRKAQA